MNKKQQKPTKKRIVLLDAHAIIHRAYHALPDFKTPSGEPAGALYGIISMLIKIIQELSPDYLIACYDLPKPTIRHEAYEGYKSTRAKSDDALVAQIIRSREIFEAFSVPIYEREGFEADDVLGTIAYELQDRKDIEIIIASGDMDTLQLVDGKRVQVYTLKKGINDTILYDEKAVETRFNFSPVLIPDYKGLRGDPSDNIIGIPGIGEKTATILVVNFGTIENIYKKLKESEQSFIDCGIKPRIINLLKEHEDDALFSKALATIRTDAPISFRIPKKEWEDTVKANTVLGLFDDLGFRSLRDRARAVLVKDNDEVVEEEQENIPSEKLSEAQIMLWLLTSDITNPSLDDILSYTKKHLFSEAFEILEQQIDSEGRLREVYENIEKPLINIVQNMHKHGVLVDVDVLTKLSSKYHKELSAISSDIYKIVGHEFNINSPKQLGEILFDELALKPKNQKKTSTGQRSTRESELEKIRHIHPIIEKILEYREIQKLLSTYIDNLPALLDSGNRLHAQFLQAGTTTGRMASQNPNLQNIPTRSSRGKLIRNAFIATEGFTLVSFDYSQIELRLAAILSKDSVLLDIFRSGRDVHTEVAARVFHVNADDVSSEMRHKAKTINFGMLYGMGINALRLQLGTSTTETREFYDGYFKEFPQLANYLEETKGFARTRGYTETMFGRRRQFPDMKSNLAYVRAHAERMVINAPIQGAEADIIKLAMVRINKMLDDKSFRNDVYLLLQVHDELIYEVRNEKVKELSSLIGNIMESVVPLKETYDVPLIVKGKKGGCWGKMDSIV